MQRRTPGPAGVLAILFLLSGCAVGLEPLQAQERTDPGSDAATETDSQSSPGWAGAAGSHAGAAGASATEDAQPDDDPTGGSNDVPDAGLCPVTTEYALKYFNAQKDSALSPCTGSSCAAGECCWKYKGCVAQ